MTGRQRDARDDGDPEALLARVDRVVERVGLSDGDVERQSGVARGFLREARRGRCRGPRNAASWRGVARFLEAWEATPAFVEGWAALRRARTATRRCSSGRGRRTQRVKIVPGLAPRKLSSKEYHEHCPEKIELLYGGLFGGEVDRERFLVLLLANVGLRRAVELAPRVLWEKALAERS